MSNKEFTKFRFIKNNLSTGDFDTATQYADEDMLEDVNAELQKRYPESQKGISGESIQPVVIPLVSRYLDESANIYATGVESRELIREDGTVDEEITKKYNDHLKEIAFDHTKASHERYIQILNSCPIYYEENSKNQLAGQIYLPQDVTPVEFQDKPVMSLGDIDAYAGFAVAMRDEELAQSGRDRYALITPNKIYNYEAKIGQPENASNIITKANPYGVQTLSIWNRRKPARELIPKAVASVFLANRELNIIWSIILDIIRFQGGGTLVKNVIDPDEIGARGVSGVRFTSVVNVDEAVGYINSANDYAGLISALTSFMRLIALTNRLSPADFSLEGSQVASGFAKILDSLPKIEARQERKQWFEIMERNDWPRQASVLIKAGVLPEQARGLKLRTKFKDPGNLKSVDEDIKQQEFDFKWGLSSPIEVVMNRDNITREEAMVYIQANKQDTDSYMNQHSPLALVGQDKQARELELTKLIGAKDAGKKQGVDRATSRSDRSKRDTEAPGSLDRAKDLEERAKSGDAGSKK